MTRSSRAPRLVITLASLALVAMIIAACAAGGSDPTPASDSADTPAGASQHSAREGEVAAPAPSQPPADGLMVDDLRGENGAVVSSARRYAAADKNSVDLAEVASIANNAPPQPDSLSPLVISTGAVALKSDDVDQARFDVMKVILHFAGQVTQEETRTNDDGDIKTSLLVVRVPSKHFAAAMTALEKVADLEMSSTNSEDVTTQVIDNQVRIRVERRSIARIQTLLDRARTIRDIVRIESQLTRRQANLNSTLRRQAYLMDQTSLSTINVSLERSKDPAVTETVHAHSKVDTTGFAAGLNSGWHNMTVAAVGIATFAGVSLPWLVVLLLLAPFAWLAARPVVRRLRAPETEPAA